MRKISREAVIFMLFGMLLSGVGTFVYLHHSQAEEIRAQLTELKRECDSIPSWAIGTSGPIGSYEHGHSRGECQSVFGASWQQQHPAVDLSGGFVPKPSSDPYTKYGGAISTNDGIEGLPPGAVAKTIGGVSDSVQFAPRINVSIDNLANIVPSAIGACFGFVGGFGVWLFYRLVRFAVKG
jgi:hypothetical protein